MPNTAGFKASVAIGGTTVATRTSIDIAGTHSVVDVTDLGDWIDNAGRGIMNVDVNLESAYKNQSGRNWTCTLGAGYTGAELDSVGISWANAPIATEDAADYLTQRVAGPANVTLTATTKYNTTAHFFSMLDTAASSNTSLACTVTDSNGSAVLTGTMRVTRGGMRMATRAAIDQSFEAKVIGVTAVGVSAKFLRWAKTAASGAGTKTVRVTSPAGTLLLTGTGTVLGATLNAAKDGAVRETMTVGIHAMTGW